ncbi:MAG TPA: hypothetical protein VK666_17715 [Chryseolinea sp.]|nr:hypothetical protein [Chryseolinea sp.]
MKLGFGLLLVLSVCTVSSVVAQLLPANGLGGGTGTSLSDHQLIIEARKGLGEKSEEKIEGTEYLSEDFVAGDVITKKGIYKAVPMRYNVYKDYIEFKQKEGTFILDPGPDVHKVIFDTYSMVVGSYDAKGKTANGFFLLLDSGKVSLLEKKIVKFKAAEAPKAIETEGKPPRYEKSKDEFMYRLGTGPITEVSSVKKLIESLPDHQEEVSKFASKEKISKNEEELTKLVKYYNSL